MAETVFSQMYAIMRESYPRFAELWAKSRQDFGPEWEKDFSQKISKLFGDTRNERWTFATDGYAEFCTDALRAQVFFDKHGRYQASNYDDVFKNCYSNYDYMGKRYLPGQYLSHYVWPHHHSMLRRYLAKLPDFASGVKTFFEVGVGCGMYSHLTLEKMPGTKGTAFDISQHSLDFAANVMKVNGLADRYSTRNCDIIKNPPSDKCDLIICQEVLEHLEDPQLFIGALRNMTKENGLGYITAAINAGHTDHIYLYRKPEEVQAQLEKAGWKILDTHIEQAYPEKPEHQRPTIAGYFLRKV